MKTLIALLFAVALPFAAHAQEAERAPAAAAVSIATGGQCVVPVDAAAVEVTLNGVAYSCVPAVATQIPTCGTGYGLGNDMCLCDYGDFTSIVDCPKYYIHDAGLDF